MRRPGGPKTYELFAEAVGAPSGSKARRKRPSPFSIRFSESERQRLQNAAGNLPLGEYIKQRLFHDLPAVPRQNGVSRVDKEAIGQALAALGQSKLASNMNQIARAANIGTLPIDAELTLDLQRACAEITALRQALLKAMGLRAVK